MESGSVSTSTMSLSSLGWFHPAPEACECWSQVAVKSLMISSWIAGAFIPIPVPPFQLRVPREQLLLLLMPSLPQAFPHPLSPCYPLHPIKVSTSYDYPWSVILS